MRSMYQWSNNILAIISPLHLVAASAFVFFLLIIFDKDMSIKVLYLYIKNAKFIRENHFTLKFRIMRTYIIIFAFFMSSCLAKTFGYTNENQKIFGGEDAEQGQFPYQV